MLYWAVGRPGRSLMIPIEASNFLTVLSTLPATRSERFRGITAGRPTQPCPSLEVLELEFGQVSPDAGDPELSDAVPSSANVGWAGVDSLLSSLFFFFRLFLRFFFF